MEGRVVRRLVGQFPELALLSLTPLATGATDNVVHRLGDRLVLRLPRHGRAEAQIEKDVRWLPEFEAHLSVRVPHIVAVGEPDEAFPYRWTVQRWIDGRDAVAVAPVDWIPAARFLARVLDIWRQAVEARSGRTHRCGCTGT
jgi:aminoglycoside phosphotransferase (APT) family kinase protein